LPIHNIIFLVLTLISHLGASIFFAKPKYNKYITSIIWLSYSVIFLTLSFNNPVINFLVSFIGHFILFFITTKDRIEEKGFLFLSYACVNTCFSIVFNIIDIHIDNTPLEIMFCVIIFVIMQFVLYFILLPSFKKVTPFIKKGWEKFYAVVVSFFVLVVTQAIVSINSTLSLNEIVVFIFTVISFCITYIVLFNSMKNMIELSLEKQRTIQTELLQAQVDAQAKESEVVRQNRHDMRHHYQMLLALAKDGEHNKIIDYLERQTESIETMNMYKYCENETINNVLRVYSKKATDANIDINIVAFAKPHLSASSPDLVKIVANILENALNGAVKSKMETPYINISIKHKSQHLVINCENSCVSQLNYIEIPEYLYGIGIHSIISTAEKYNGTYSFSAKNGIFSVKIVIDE
jgi:hypothetical protein